MLGLGETSLSADEALKVVARLLDAIDKDGLEAVCAGSKDVPRERPTETKLRAALSSLSTCSRSTAAMIADALVEKVFEAFQPVLRQFQKTMQNAGYCESVRTDNCSSAFAEQHRALQQLFSAFVSVREVLVSWCQVLCIPEAVAEFVLYVRCVIMQPDVLSGEMPRGWKELLAFLFAHGKESLCAEGAQGDFVEGGARECDEQNTSLAALDADPVLSCLDALGMGGTREIKRLWHDVLVACIEDKIAALDDDYTRHAIQSYLDWEEEVVEPFVRVSLSRYDTQPSFIDHSSTFFDDAPRIETSSCQPYQMPKRSNSDAVQCKAHSVADCGDKDRWCSELRERLLLAFARKRIVDFWDVMVEYPDSVPALEDLRFCLQSCPRTGIKEELTSHLRTLLSTRLHRAGTRTEDILVMLSKSVNSLWVLVPRNEQSTVVFSVVSDTLDYLRQRKDCVPAVVQVLTQSGTDTAFGHAPDAGEQEGGADALGDFDEQGETDAYGGDSMRRGTNGRERPDILRILLTAIPVRSLTEEYQLALAQQLLAKDLHDFDTTPEEEVLERLKCVLGGDVTPNCEVMVHDIQSSKRTTNQLREYLAQNGRRSMGRLSPLRSAKISLDVLSLTAWPKLSHCVPVGEPALPPEKYRCHPSLQHEMDRIAEAFKHLKQGQKLLWLLSQGRITLEVKQQRSEGSEDLVATTFTLSVFSASVFLYMMELDVAPRRAKNGAGNGGCSLETLAAKLDVSADTLRPYLSHMIPSLLYWSETEGDASAARINVQRVLPTQSHVLFEEAGQESDEGQPKSSLDDDQIGLLRTMAVAMLQNGGAATIGDIMNSLKMFTGLSLTAADMKHLMHTLTAEGSVVQTDAKTYRVS